MEPFHHDGCIITQPPHVRLPGLCFLQGDYVVVDAPCTFEKGVEIGVGGNCPGVVGAEPETISMASRSCPLIHGVLCNLTLVLIHAVRAMNKGIFPNISSVPPGPCQAFTTGNR
ncbi:unnamed protein product [Strongylus vulgaris]|uniref:Uncharacterized protein n=1 Tax=Strongylus vulgaris TaxID=40348 RepID=A0A3P7I1M4_STRVU|nr:unnamed protein product [Strongylus vulgaris]